MSEATQVVEDVLGIRLNVQEDEEEQEVRERQTLTAPPPEGDFESDDDDEGEDDSPEEVVAEKSSVEIMNERLASEKAQPGKELELEREIRDLKARWEGQNSVLDKIISGREEKPSAPSKTAVDEFANPAVAKMLSEYADDPEQQLRLLATISDQLAERKVAERMKPIEERLSAFDQRTKQQSDTDQRIREVARAVEYMQKNGSPTEKSLVEDFKSRGAESHLMQVWKTYAESTRDHRAMILLGTGLANAFDRAAKNGTEAPEATVRQAAKEASTGPRPKASRRNEEITQPKTSGPDNARSIVLDNLRAARRIGPNPLDAF